MKSSVSISVPLLVIVLVVSIAETKSNNTYTCPDCGEVKDCLNQCDGFHSTDEDHNICFDRRLFGAHNTNATDHEDHYHYLWNDIVGAFVWFIMAGVATACGVGGGGIYVPLGILLFAFAPKQSSALSQCSIFGASLGGLILNSRNYHPEVKIRSDAGVITSENELPRQKKNTPEEEEAYKDAGNDFYTRPVIDFDMALFLSPMEMAGAVLGVVIQTILPNWLYLLIAALVLSFTAFKTYKKFFQAREKEKKSEAEKVVVSAGVKVSERELEVENGGAAGNGETVENGEATEIQIQKKRTEEENLKLRIHFLKEDMVQYPKGKIIPLVILWAGLATLTILKGGKGLKGVTTCESPWFYVLIAAQFLWMFGFAVYYGIKLMQKQAVRLEVGYPYLPDDPVWDVKNVQFFGIFTFIAGIVAGLIGIGGGMVLGPLMLVMGIHPRVSSATTATMIVLTSSTVAVLFVVSNIIPWSYAVFYFSVCFCGAMVGKSKIDGYVKRTGRASLLIFILATIITIATIGCIFIMFQRLAKDNWDPAPFNAFCNVKSNVICAGKSATRLLSWGQESLEQ